MEDLKGVVALQGDESSVDVGTNFFANGWAQAAAQMIQGPSCLRSLWMVTNMFRNTSPWGGYRLLPSRPSPSAT